MPTTARALCGAILTLSLCGAAAAQPSGRAGEVRPVVVSGRPSDGGVVFTRVESPQVDTAGNVAFRAEWQRSGPTAVPDGTGIYHASAAGQLSRVAGRDDPAPGAPQGVQFHDFGAAAHFHLADNGRLALDGTLYRPSNRFPPEIVGGGAWSWSPQGGLQPVAVPGAPVPGMPGVTYALASGGYTRSDGAVAFTALLQGQGIPAPHQDAAFFKTPSGDVVLLAREGEQVPGLPAGTVFTGIPAVRTFPSGDGVVVGGLTDVQSDTSGVILAGTPGNLGMVAAVNHGPPHPLGPLRTVAPRTLDTAGAGRIAFGGSRAFNNYVFSGTNSGDLAGYAGGNITDPHSVNASGQVAYGVRNFSSSGIRTGVGGRLIRIASEGDPVPGAADPNWTFGRFEQPDVAVNDAGLVAFTARIPLGPGMGPASGVFLYDPDAGLAPVALSFDTVELAPGVVGEFGSFGSVSMSDGFLVFDARLLDGSWGVFSVAVPEPRAVVWACGAGALVLARRRRPVPDALPSAV